MTLRANNALGASDQKVQNCRGRHHCADAANGLEQLEPLRREHQRRRLFCKTRGRWLIPVSSNTAGPTSILTTRGRAQRGGTFNAIQGNEKFPDMKGMCDADPRAGIEIRHLFDAVDDVLRRHIPAAVRKIPEGSGPNRPAGKPREQKNPAVGDWQISFATNDADQWAAWGMDYLKYDWNPIELPGNAGNG